MHGDFIGSGWAFPVGVDSHGSIALVSGTEELEQAMRLILTTYPGERPMRSEFGCRLRDYVFAPADTGVAAALSHDVRVALERWEPRVDVIAVNVVPDNNQVGRLYIDIHYEIKATNDRRNLVFPFYTIPYSQGEE